MKNSGSSLKGEGDCEAWYARPKEACGEGERLLACGAAAVADLRAAVQAELGFSCSAGEPRQFSRCFLLTISSDILQTLTRLCNKIE